MNLKVYNTSLVNKNKKKKKKEPKCGVAFFPPLKEKAHKHLSPPGRSPELSCPGSTPVEDSMTKDHTSKIPFLNSFQYF